jgi:type IV secretion system protein VirD4
MYLFIQSKNFKKFFLIFNLFFNCAIKINLSKNPDFNPELKYNILISLNEFSSIGNIPYVKKSAGYMAGYKLQLLTLFQNISQLNKIYENLSGKTLLANH